MSPKSSSTASAYKLAISSSDEHFPTLTSVVRRPIPNSYWATPLLLACEYPWTPYLRSHSRAVQKLDLLLNAGVRTFIDLTEHGELSSYAPHLGDCAQRLGINRADIEYHSFPIPDRCTPASLDFVYSIMRVLADNATRGRITAVHCRGGIGRTGTVVGCWLVESGIAADGPQALAIIAREWQTVEKCKRFPHSPETGGQCEFVKNFVPLQAIMQA
jgi:atypical dual specificity phosphatase